MDTSTLLPGVQSQLTEVQSSINQGGISGALKNTLVNNEAMLQGWIKRLMSSGSLTDTDVLTLNNDLAGAKKQTLEAAAQRSKRNFIIVLTGTVVVIVGAIFIIKKVSKK